MFEGAKSVQEVNQLLQSAIAQAGMQFNCGASGNARAQVAIIGEAPGEHEARTKVPLIGPSGRLLWNVLRAQNISRNDVYVTNVVKRSIEGINIKGTARKRILPDKEVIFWKALLLSELRALSNLKCIIVLGSLALETIIQEKSITNWRGSLVNKEINGRKVTVLCANNPAHILREPKTEITFKFDMSKLPLAVSGKYVPPTYNTIINPSIQVVEEYLDHLVGEGKPIAFDIETIGRSTACVGFANSATEGICIPFRTDTGNIYFHNEEVAIRERIARVLADPANRFVAQNGNFDSYWLGYWDRIKVHRVYFDTMLAHHTLYPTLPHNLGYLTTQYTQQAFYKDDGKTWRSNEDIDQFWRYNIMDCCVTFQAHEKLLKELREQELDQFFFSHVMRLQPHLTNMTLNGVLADISRKDDIAAKLEDEVMDLRAKFIHQVQAITRDPDYSINPNSPKQLSKLFFEDLRLVGRGTSTNAENRDRIRENPKTSEPAREMLTLLDTYAEKHKFFSVYATARVDDDNRIRCEYKQTGVQSAPGRLSSAMTMWGNGGNLQNIPEAAKEMYVADEGYEFNYFDMSQIEARFVACFAKIEMWIEQFEMARLNPGTYDAHCALAAQMFNLPIEQVPKYDFEPDGTKTIRFTAKRCRHGLNYRMQPARLAITAGMTRYEAIKNHAIYHRLMPELQVWWKETIDEAMSTGMLFTPLGRRWLLLDRSSEDSLDSAVAFRPQSLAGDWVQRVIYKSHEDPRWPVGEAAIIMNIHDALIAINKIGYGKQVREIMREYAQEPIEINGYTMIVPAEFGVSQPDDKGIHRWSTIKKLKQGEL